MAGKRAGDRPYFFLSYARTPRLDRNSATDPNLWVHKLYEDLSNEVLQLISSPVAGFMDREIRVGQKWSSELTAALRNCRVFVPLYSPRYFASDNCGKEWYAFSRRVLDQRARQPDTEMAIVPALWVPVDEENLPSVAREIQFNHHELSDMYGRGGFSGIMKISRFQDDYTLAVQGLARRIVEVARNVNIDPGGRTDFATSESAFGDSDVHEMADKRIQLTVVSPDAAHLPDGRGGQYYGKAPRDWRPYHPAASMPIVDYAAELAHYLGCNPRITTLEDHLKDVARGAKGPGLFLIDAWAAKSPGCCADLRRLDELNQYWTGVLHPRNREDEQTMTAEGLRAELESCLDRKLADLPRQYREQALNIETIEDFGDVMAPMLMRMRRRFLNRSDPVPPDPTTIERPRLWARGDDEYEGTR